LKPITKASRIRTKQIFANAQIPAGEGPGVTLGSAFWTAQDDIRIIGFMLSMGMKIVGALQEGRVNGHAELSRGAHGDIDAIFGEITPWVGFWTEIVVATQLAGSFGDPSRDIVVMFPEGHGIDVDEGESINLFVYAGNTMMASGTADIDSEAHIYYIER